MSTRLVRRTLLSPSWSSACCAARRTRFDTSLLFTARLSTSASSPAPPVGKDQDASRGPHLTTRAEEYLASLRAAGFEPSLEDIERCRPQKHAEPSSVAYITQYNNLLSTLCHSFSKEQLKRFAQLYGLPAQWTRSSKRKVHYAEAIIEQQWKWPSLKEAEKLYRDSTEECMESFPVTPSQLFLILGKDGADLLQLSIEYKVHIGLSSSPLALRVEGLRGDISELTQVIESLKQGILEEYYQLPTKRSIRQDLLQRISRLAGAYVENVDQAGMIRICAKDPTRLASAQRLAVRAATEPESEAVPRTLCYIPSEIEGSSLASPLFPREYSLYPFSPPRALPWTMNTTGTFRLRRVTEWLSSNISEDLQRGGGLSSDSSQIVDNEELPYKLRDILLGDGIAASGSGSQRIITASLGHLLVFSGTGFHPPLKGHWKLSKILRWLKANDVKQAFVPSLPALLLKSQPNRQKIINRLVYQVLRSNDGHIPSSATRSIIRYDIDLTDLAMSQQIRDTTQHDSIVGDSLDSSTIASSPYEAEGNDVATDLTGFSLRDAVSGLPAREPECFELTDSDINLMLPDRPMDLHFSVSDRVPIAVDSQPAELQEYSTKLSDFMRTDKLAVPPQPPIEFDYKEKTYILQNSSNVRQSQEDILRSNDNIDGVSVISESTLDLESHQNSTTCQIVCQTATYEAWKCFLANCDHLSASASVPKLGLNSDSESK